MAKKSTAEKCGSAHTVKGIEYTCDLALGHPDAHEDSQLEAAWASQDSA